jgi:hypothetical protein
MKLKACLSAASLGLAIMGFAASANALPLSGPADGIAAESQVVKVHGCHRSCEWGPVLRWHRHIGPACRPVACWPRAVNPRRCWVDAAGYRHCRW